MGNIYVNCVFLRCVYNYHFWLFYLIPIFQSVSEGNKKNVTQKFQSHEPVYFTCISHHVRLNSSTVSKNVIIETSKWFIKMLMSRSKTKKYCACVSSRRKPYVRQAEAVTSFLLPDCHHGEFAMRVLAFLIRISFHISQCSGATRVVCVANTIMSTFVKCLFWHVGIFRV